MVFINNFLLKNRVLIFIVFIGIAVRLFVMPFTAHPDFASAQWRANQITTHHHFFLDTKDFLSTYVLAANLVLIDVLGIFELDKFHDNWGVEGSFGTVGLADYIIFIDDPSIMQFLFFAKLPYLLFEIVAYIILLRLFPRHKLLVSVLLWLNFFSIFSNYIYGRYEIFAIPFLFLSFYYQKHGKEKQSLALLLVSTFFRFSYIILVPLWIAINWEKIKVNARESIRFALIFVAFFALHYFISTYGYRIDVNETPNPNDYVPIASSMQIISGKIGNLSIFLTLYILAIISLFHVSFRNKFTVFVMSCFTVFALHFIVNTWSVHYLSWLFYISIPTLVLMQSWYKKSTHKILFLFFLVTFVGILVCIMKSDAAVFAPGLLAPVDVAFLDVEIQTPFVHLFQHFFGKEWSQAHVLTVFRSIFSGIILYMTYLSIRTLYKAHLSKKEPHV